MNHLNHLQFKTAKLRWQHSSCWQFYFLLASLSSVAPDLKPSSMVWHEADQCPSYACWNLTLQSRPLVLTLRLISKEWSVSVSTAWWWWVACPRAFQLLVGHHNHAKLGWALVNIARRACALIVCRIINHMMIMLTRIRICINYLICQAFGFKHVYFFNHRLPNSHSGINKPVWYLQIFNH